MMEQMQGKNVEMSLALRKERQILGVVQGLGIGVRVKVRGVRLGLGLGLGLGEQANQWL